MIGIKSNCGYFQTSKWWWYSNLCWRPALKILGSMKYWSPASKSPHRVESKPLTASTSSCAAVSPHFLCFSCTSHFCSCNWVFALAVPFGELCPMVFLWLAPSYPSGLRSIYFLKKAFTTTLPKVAPPPITPYLIALPHFTPTVFLSIWIDLFVGLCPLESKLRDGRDLVFLVYCSIPSA